MGKGCSSGSGGGGYLSHPLPSGLNDFYQGIRGVYRPTDGNLFAPRQTHEPMQFNPIKQYEGAPKNPLTFNTGTTYQRSQSIDNKVTGTYDPQRQGTTEASYLRIPSFMDYSQ